MPSLRGAKCMSGKGTNLWKWLPVSVSGWTLLQNSLRNKMRQRWVDRMWAAGAGSREKISCSWSTWTRAIYTKVQQRDRRIWEDTMRPTGKAMLVCGRNRGRDPGHQGKLYGRDRLRQSSRMSRAYLSNAMRIGFWG